MFPSVFRGALDADSVCCSKALLIHKFPGIALSRKLAGWLAGLVGPQGLMVDPPSARLTSPKVVLI